MTWPEVAARAAACTLAVPVGSTEQHGPHLPLSTDTDVATALAERLGASCDDVIVAPPCPYGSSGEHAAFAGTLSIGQRALELVVVELVRSADAFDGVVLVSGHGGNAAPISRAVDRLTAEGRGVLAWAPDAGQLSTTGPADAHAGRTETSLMLALAPSSVRCGRVEAGERRPVGELMAALRRGGVIAVSANGVLGDPTAASAEEGLVLLDGLAAELCDAVARWRLGRDRAGQPTPDGSARRRCAEGGATSVAMERGAGPSPRVGAWGQSARAARPGPAR